MNKNYLYIIFLLLGNLCTLYTCEHNHYNQTGFEDLPPIQEHIVQEGYCNSSFHRPFFLKKRIKKLNDKIENGIYDDHLNFEHFMHLQAKRIQLLKYIQQKTTFSLPEKDTLNLASHVNNPYTIVRYFFNHWIGPFNRLSATYVLTKEGTLQLAKDNDPLLQNNTFYIYAIIRSFISHIPKLDIQSLLTTPVEERATKIQEIIPLWY